MADESLAHIDSSGIYQILNLTNGKRYIGSAQARGASFRPTSEGVA